MSSETLNDAPNLSDDTYPHNKFDPITKKIKRIINVCGYIAIGGSTICGIAAVFGIVAMIWEKDWISISAQYISHFGTVLCAFAAIASLFYLKKIQIEMKKMVATPTAPDT